jgi:hypothetical protein
VCLDGPEGLARDVRDEARACSPEQVAAERVRYKSCRPSTRVRSKERGVQRTAIARPEAVRAEHPQVRRSTQLETV